jgi:hypothetical protein
MNSGTWNAGTLELLNFGTISRIPDLSLARGRQEMKLVPVFNIQEDQFIRYELPVNH